MKPQRVTMGGTDFVLIPLLAGTVTTVTVREVNGEVKTTIHRIELPVEKKEYGPITVDPISSRVWVSGRECHLTKTVFGLLCYLAERQGQLLTYEELAIACDITPSKNSVCGLMHRLKQSLGDGAGRWIKNVPNRGYVFQLPKKKSIDAAGEPMAHD